FAGKAAKSVTATFTATAVGSPHSLTCTSSNGTFSDTKAAYDGTATSSDPSLNGSVRLALHSLINTTSNLGVVRGELTLHAGSSNTVAHVVAVYTNGSIAGL